MEIPASRPKSTIRNYAYLFFQTRFLPEFPPGPAPGLGGLSGKVIRQTFYEPTNVRLTATKQSHTRVDDVHVGRRVFARRPNENVHAHIISRTSRVSREHDARAHRCVGRTVILRAKGDATPLLTSSRQTVICSRISKRLITTFVRSRCQTLTGSVFILFGFRRHRILT